ncbi:MAG: M48 family metallopeptidase [Polyangiaceae bacterium]
MDLEPLVFDGDRRTRDQLMDDVAFATVAKELAEAAPCISARRALLAGSLKLTEGIAPDAFRALRRAKKRLKVKGVVELYCVQDPHFNAFVTESSPGKRGSKVLIALSSAALMALDVKELTFVIGHELGHVLFDHLSLHPQGFASHATIAPLHMARLYAWMRYAELTADRVGLFCCRDYDVAVRVSFKMTSGLTDERFLQRAAESADQYAELAREEIDSSAEDWFSTHPYSPLRLRALDLFARSRTFHDLCDSDGGDLSEAELEEEVQALMLLMDPSFLEEREDIDDLRDFLALAGRWVALADGTETADERAVLDHLLRALGAPQGRDRVRSLSGDQMATRLVALGDKLNLTLSPVRKHKVVEDLLAVAMADQLLHDAEIDALADIVALLGADRMDVQAGLGRLQAALD